MSTESNVVALTVHVPGPQPSGGRGALQKFHCSALVPYVVSILRNAIMPPTKRHQ